MEILHQRCAGIDVSKRDAKVCVRIQGRGRRPTEVTITSWGATTAQILSLRDMLIAARVTAVVIESTGDYWRPFFYLLEDELNLILVNAREAKTVPGRKTDVADSAWLAELGAHGLVRASYVPPPPIRELRELTRSRAAIVRDRAREIQRLEKHLEDAQIKLSSVVSDLSGVGSRRILTAIADGITDPAQLVSLKGKLRVSDAELAEALTGRVSDHHRFMIRLRLGQLDNDSAAIAALEQRIEELVAPFRAARDLLISIPGFSKTVAEVVIAETGADMTVFPTPGHLCSWAGVAPGQHQSARTRKNAPTRPGDKHLKAALGVAAMSVAKQRHTYFGVKYRRLAARRGKMKALVAVQRAMLTAAWHMLTTGAYYQDPGPDYYQRHDPARRTRRAIRDLTALGYQVTLQPLQKAS